MYCIAFYVKNGTTHSLQYASLPETGFWQNHSIAILKFSITWHIFFLKTTTFSFIFITWINLEYLTQFFLGFLKVRNDFSTSWGKFDRINMLWPFWHCGLYSEMFQQETYQKDLLILQHLFLLVALQGNLDEHFYWNALGNFTI